MVKPGSKDRKASIVSTVAVALAANNNTANPHRLMKMDA